MSKPRVALLRCPASTANAEITARTEQAIAMVGGLRERFAGKKAACRMCGNVNRIPSAEYASLRPTAVRWPPRRK